MYSLHIIRLFFDCYVIPTFTPTVGKPYVTEEGILPATHCPPPGYHSVEGKVGKVLNYEEVVVYQASQAIPSYLIVYSLPPLEDSDDEDE